jgi:hypothetical protein
VRTLFLLLAFCPTLAVGQDMVFDPAPTQACLAAAPADLASCIGHAADACMAENPQGETTMGMGFCLSQEWEWWDARLNAAYGALMATHEAGDAATKAEGLAVPSGGRGAARDAARVDRLPRCRLRLRAGAMGGRHGRGAGDGGLPDAADGREGAGT